MSLLIRGYQSMLSPFLGVNCRFYPSCSQYVLDSVNTWGVNKGLLLGLKRLCRCHPWSAGGWDPVPVQNEIFNEHHPL